MKFGQVPCCCGGIVFGTDCSGCVAGTAPETIKVRFSNMPPAANLPCDQCDNAVDIFELDNQNTGSFAACNWRYDFPEDFFTDCTISNSNDSWLNLSVSAGVGAGTRRWALSWVQDNGLGSQATMLWYSDDITEEELLKIDCADSINVEIDLNWDSVSGPFQHDCYDLGPPTDHPDAHIEVKS